jgi:hypothetical protein
MILARLLVGKRACDTQLAGSGGRGKGFADAVDIWVNAGRSSVMVPQVGVQPRLREGSIRERKFGGALSRCRRAKVLWAGHRLKALAGHRLWRRIILGCTARFDRIIGS